jgi:1-acyl-sn-glycerol-3-phosphate acyltransferase
MALSAVITLGVVLMALIRFVEKPVHGAWRPWTPWITQWVCRSAFIIFGMRHDTTGEPMKRPGAVVANHVSWLDIFALNAGKRVYFVAKSELAGWPGIGLLAKMTGTVFIARDRKQAKDQQDVFKERLLAGHKLLFFPEGTSTDGMRVLPFKSTLFQAFFTLDLRPELHIQPVTVIYSAPDGQDARFYGWWGEMDFGSHLVKMLAAKRHGAVKIVYHQPVKVDNFKERKALATHVEGVVRGGMPRDRQIAE